VETVVNYLNWDQEDRGPASTLFHELHTTEPEIPDLELAEFEDLYREVRELELEEPVDLEQVWREWNRGSGYESEEFHEMRYCEPCQTYQIGSNQVIQHAVDNHGYDAFEEFGEPEYVHGIRSMSVGDVVGIGDKYHVAVPIGWEELTVGGEQ